MTNHLTRLRILPTRLPLLAATLSLMTACGTPQDEVKTGASGAGTADATDAAAAQDAAATDAGKATKDAGAVAQDTGGGTKDAGGTVKDAGTPPKDAGKPPKDAGTPPKDAGKPVDSGPADVAPPKPEPGFVRSYGGSANEETPAVTRLSGGDLLLAGYTASFGAGDWDGFAMRTSTCGKVVWRHTYGGKGKDRLAGAAGTSDGGAWLVGSWDTAGDIDAMALKVDAAGKVKSAARHGGTGYDAGEAVAATSDGGAAVAAKTYTFGPGTPKSHNMMTYRLDAAGKTMWERSFGGAKDGDAGFSVVATSDKAGKTDGFVFAGATESWGSGDDDIWVMRLDASGKHVWSKAIGGNGDDEARGVFALTGGRLAVVGFTDGLGAKKDDALVLELDATGALKWSMRLAGSGSERAYAAVQSGGALYVCGRSDSLGGGDDGYLARIGTGGKLQWARRAGGSKGRQVASALALEDGSVVMAGYTIAASGNVRHGRLGRTGAKAAMGCGGKQVAAAQLSGITTKVSVKGFTPGNATGMKSTPLKLKAAAIGASFKAMSACADKTCAP